MSVHPILHALNSRPVNKQAAVVARQSGCTEELGHLTREELARLQERLVRKHRLLKQVLRIKTKAQHVNLVNKFKKRQPSYRFAANPRSVIEYVRCGKEIQRLSAELAIDRQCRRLASSARPQEVA